MSCHSRVMEVLEFPAGLSAMRDRVLPSPREHFVVINNLAVVQDQGRGTLIPVCLTVRASKGRSLKTTEQADDHGIDQVNEKTTHQWHDQEGLVRRAVLLCHGRHIDDGCRRGAEGDPAKS